MLCRAARVDPAPENGQAVGLCWAVLPWAPAAPWVVRKEKFLPSAHLKFLAGHIFLIQVSHDTRAFVKS